MDRSKSSSNHKDIVCGSAFEANDVLQELSRLRHLPVELVKSKQEDAHELLCQLLSEIHDEICQILYQSSPNKNGKEILTILLFTLLLIPRRIDIKFRSVYLNSGFTIEW